MIKASAARILPVEPVKARRGAVAMMPRKKALPPRALVPWLSPYKQVTRLSAKGREMLGRAVDRLWKVARTAQTEEEAEDYTLALGIFRAIRQGWSMPVLIAYEYTFGVHPYRFKRYRLERRTLRALELLKAAQRAERRKKGAVVIEFPRIPRRRGMRAQPHLKCSQCSATASEGKSLCPAHLIKNRERVQRCLARKRAG